MLGETEQMGGTLLLLQEDKKKSAILVLLEPHLQQQLSNKTLAHGVELTVYLYSRSMQSAAVLY